MSPTTLSCGGWGCGMAESPRLGWPYPDERARSWYPDFQALVNALDASVYASLSAPHFIFSGGGTLVWDASTGGLTWSGAFTLSAPGTGFKWTIAAGSAVLADGDYGAVTIEPGITEAVSVNVSVLTRIEDLTTNAVLFRRIGSDLVFRTGHVIAGTRTVVATDLFGQALTQDELSFEHKMSNIHNANSLLDHLERKMNSYFNQASVPQRNSALGQTDNAGSLHSNI